MLEDITSTMDYNETLYFPPDKNHEYKAKRAARRQSNKKYRNRLNKIYHKYGGYFYQPVYEKIGDDGGTYYKRAYYNSKFHKHKSNKAFRRYKTALQYGKYKRCYDYRNQIF